MVRFDNENRHPDEAGAFVLPMPERANSIHSPTTTELLRTTELTSVSDLRVLKKLRHAAPRVWRLGPRAGMITLTLLRSGGTLSYEELASKLGISRPRDLRRKGGVVERMESVGMISCSETGVSLTSGWHNALEVAREMGREERAERIQQSLHQAERERRTYYRNKNESTI